MRYIVAIAIVSIVCGQAQGADFTFTSSTYSAAPDGTGNSRTTIGVCDRRVRSYGKIGLGSPWPHPHSELGDADISLGSN